MSYGVHYRTSGGESRFETMSALDDAVALVERLRNDQQTTDARLFREVPLEVRTYVKVAVRDESAPAGSAAGASVRAESVPVDLPAATPSAPSTPPPGAMPLAPPVPSTPPSDAGTEGDDSQHRRAGLFSRS